MSLLFPKAGPRPKKPKKPLKRSRIKPGHVTFKCWDTGKRSRRIPDCEVQRLAQKARLERLRNSTEAEIALEAILRRSGKRHEREFIIQNGDRWVLADFLIPALNLILEVDGVQHRHNRAYDKARSLWLARKGYKVVRFWNADVSSGEAEDRIRRMLGLRDD